MSTTDPSVVCGVDGSRASAAAIRVAARLASAMDRRLILTSAVADRSAGPSAGPGLQTFCRIERAEILVLSSQEESPGVAVSEAAGGGKCPVIAVPPESVMTYSAPSLPIRTSRMRCFMSVSMASSSTTLPLISLMRSSIRPFSMPTKTLPDQAFDGPL